ncbi:hypothetical protein M0Q97_00920, partial [Candidatus Dojkabacteria bacterium]|nr:hypothetical protein [Candidatus Dojkabacteria bacterium]
IKLTDAIKLYPNVKYVLVGGGVFNSEEILRRVGSLVREYSLEYLYPSKEFRGDNGAMIGLVGSLHIDDGLKGKELEVLDRDPRLSL